MLDDLSDFSDFEEEEVSASVVVANAVRLWKEVSLQLHSESLTLR